MSPPGAKRRAKRASTARPAVGVIGAGAMGMGVVRSLLRGGFATHARDIRPDLISGEALRYVRTGDGRFLLYSIGWNEIDEQGEAGGRGRSNNPSPDQGDWTWRYQAADGP